MGGSKYISKKYQTVLLELKFLYSDLEYHEEVLVDASLEFRKAFVKKAMEPGVISPKAKQEIAAHLGFEFTDEPQIDLSVPDETVPKDKEEAEFNNLFRKITKLTHPDLYPNESEAKKKDKIEQFIKAKKAVVNKNWFELCSVAIDLGIEIPNISAIHVKWMEAETLKIKKRVNEIKNSIIWNWFHREDKRDFYMDNYIKQFNKNN